MHIAYEQVILGLESLSGKKQLFLQPLLIEKRYIKNFPNSFECLLLANPCGLDVSIWTNNNTIHINGAVSSKATGAIYDMLGRKIFEARLENSNLNTLSVPEATKGIYLVKVTDGEKVATQKVVF
jgi:hypothetical protein